MVKKSWVLPPGNIKLMNLRGLSSTQGWLIEPVFTKYIAVERSVIRAG